MSRQVTLAGQAPAGQPVADLVAALRSARHDLWLFVDAPGCSDDEAIRGEVAIRAIDEAIARAANCHAELVEALKLAREELAGLPHSLGYEFTHIPKIDAALSRATGSQP